MIDRLIEIGAHAAGCAYFRVGFWRTVVAKWRLSDNRSLSQRLSEVALAQHLRELFKLHHIDCVIDVGANVGQYGRFLRDLVGYEGLILSFEPVAGAFTELSAAASRDPKWKVYQLALGRSHEMRPINAMNTSVNNSFLAPAEAQPVTEFVAPHLVIDHVEHVAVRRLDDLLPDLRSEFHFARPYLKLDTQGFDLEVLAGGDTVINDIPALQTEMSIHQIYHGAPSYQDALRVFEAKGFVISNFFWVAGQQFKMIEFDCVMVRR